MSMTEANQSKHHTLLSFAHRGEAKAFLHEFQSKPLNSEGDLYQLTGPQNEMMSLLITGEGRDQVLVKLTAAIVLLRERFPDRDLQVINLGVCAGLEAHPLKLEKEQILRIATCYGQKGLEVSEMEFKSFTCTPSIEEEDNFPIADIVSTNARILDAKQAEHFSHFAPLVDRELWATGFVCAQLKCAFSSLKVVSDFADGDICARVKEETDRWSDLLLRAFLQKQTSLKGSDTNDELWPELSHLHITVSQERRLRQLLKALNLKGKSKENILEETHFNELIEKDLRPKDKTKLFLESLTNLLNPLEGKLKEALNEVTADMQQAGVSVRFDQGHESEVLHLSTALEKETQINKIITALENFDFNKFRTLMRGEEIIKEGNDV